MSINRKAKEYLYELLLKNVNGNEIINNHEENSNILSEPMFVGIKDINILNKTNLTNPKIVKTIEYKNKVLFLINGTSNNKIVGEFLIFDKDFNFITNINRHYTNSLKNSDGTDLKEEMYEFIDAKIDANNGTIYGFCKLNNKVSFFVFRNILEQIYSTNVNNADLEKELFYEILFDIETEVAVKNNEVKIGNILFKNINTTKFDFNVDFNYKNIYSFTIWDNTATRKEIHFISFSCDLGVKKSNDNGIKWLYNLPISLTTTSASSEVFDDVSTLGILTGERKISDNELSIGSIAISRQKNALTNAFLVREQQITNASDPWQFNKTSFLLRNESSILSKNVSYSNEILIYDNDSFRNEILSKIKQLTAVGNTRNTNFSEMVFTFGSNSVTINKQDNDELFKKLLSLQDTDKIGVFLKIGFIAKLESFGGKTMNVYQGFEVSINFKINDVIFKESNKFDNSKLVKTISSDDRYVYNGQSVGVDPTLNSLNLINIKTGIRTGVFGDNEKDFNNIGVVYSFDGQGNFLTYNINSYDLDVSLTGNLYFRTTMSWEREENSLGSNTTAQILIDKVEDTKEVRFKIMEREINSYEGKKAVFINPTKFYIPIKKASNNKYSIFEFNGDNYRGQKQEIEQTFNAVAIKKYDNSNLDNKFIIELNKPNSIVSVTSNLLHGSSNIISSSLYSLSGNNIIFNTTIENNEFLTIIYKTYVGAPREITIKNTTQGEDMHISSVDDYDELGTISRAIIGAGDDSFSGVQNNVFGFNLYKTAENFDYSEIAENTKSSNIKIFKVDGSRQKDIIHINGYNEDYTKVVQWIQIYPDSFTPYTYLKYYNARRMFNIQRLNSSKDGLLENSRFDREFLDAAKSENLLIFTTTADNFDLYEKDNNEIKIFGATNLELFNFKTQIEKEDFENININFQLKVDISRESSNGEVKLIDATKKLTDLFITKNYDDYSKLSIDKAIITLENNKIIELNSSRLKDLISYKKGESSIIFALSLLNHSGNSQAKNIKLLLANGEAIIDYDLPNCSGNLKQFLCHIYINDNDNILPYLTYDKTNWNKIFKQ